MKPNLIAACTSIIIGCSLSGVGFADQMPDGGRLPNNTRINEIQVLGSHNSYSAGMDPQVQALFVAKASALFENFMDKMPPEAQARYREEHPNAVALDEMLRYKHPKLTQQLDAGLRSLEIDINPDPKGGNYTDPAAYRILRAQGAVNLLPFDNRDLDKPGFKVLHIPDVDFRSNCPTLKICLSDVKSWSDAHPKHIPLFILIEAKTQDIPILPGATHTVPFSPALFDDLDREFLDVFPRDRIITPDDIRGHFATLNEAVRAKNWPKLHDARGKVLFLMLTANGPAGAAGYLEGHPSLKGRIAFLRAEPGEDHAAFLLLDNAVTRYSEIKRYVRDGYLVRTRSDIETYEAKANDMSRALAAFEGGAQIVSTDFEMPGNGYGTSYIVRLPGGNSARPNPAIAESNRCGFH